MQHFIRLTVFLIVVLGPLLLGDIGYGAKSSSPQVEHVRDLILQLGATEYSVRQRAQAELKQLGVAAFEALDSAKTNPDVEIRKQAEYLLHAIRINWIEDDDPENVKRLVRYYLEEEAPDRRARLTQIGQSEGEAGLRVLCRFARFETSDVYARYAALAILQGSAIVREVPPQQFREIVDEVLSNSDRPAAQWLLLFAREFATGMPDRAAWQELVAAELEAVQKRPERERISVARELLEWQVELAQDRQQDEAMRESLQQLLSLQAVNERSLRNTLDWLIDRKAWPLVEIVDKTYGQMIESDPFLQYRRAELWEHQGKTEATAELLDQLLQYKPNADNENVVDPDFFHDSLGLDLQRHGRFDWAEREFRQVMKDHEPDSLPAIDASFRLGYMFFDLGRYPEAYASLHELADRLLNEPDRKSLRRLQDLSRIPNLLFSQTHMSHAFVLAESKDVAGQQNALREALRYDDDNADILIAMFRIQGADEKWQVETRQRIDRLRAEYEKQVLAAQRDFDMQPSDIGRSLLAQQLNQLAWLTANTYGDFERAVQLSHRSLELAPEESGYLDTLGRCYYAAKDYKRAVRYQRHAVELDPHSGQIARQLEIFEAALAASSPPE